MFSCVPSLAIQNGPLVQLGTQNKLPRDHFKRRFVSLKGSDVKRTTRKTGTDHLARRNPLPRGKGECCRCPHSSLPHHEWSEQSILPRNSLEKLLLLTVPRANRKLYSPCMCMCLCASICKFVYGGIVYKEGRASPHF